MSERAEIIDLIGEGIGETLIAPIRIAQALERIADVLEDVTDRGRVHVDGLVITREDRP